MNGFTKRIRASRVAAAIVVLASLEFAGCADEATGPRPQPGLTASTRFVAFAPGELLPRVTPIPEGLGLEPEGLPFSRVPGDLTPASTAQLGSPPNTRYVMLEHTISGERLLVTMTGGVFGAVVGLPRAPVEWQIVGAGDFNADGKDDIVWQNNLTGARVVWNLNANGVVIGSRGLGIVPLEWSIGGTGDYNSDQQDDILWENKVTGERVVWFMDSQHSSIGGGKFATVPLEWGMMAAGDLNKDGRDDIIWWNTTTGERVVWFMRGGGVLGAAGIGVVPTEWKYGGTADLEGDGNEDILWQNALTGERLIWFMNGSASAQSFSRLGNHDPNLRIAGIVDLSRGAPSAPLNAMLRVNVVTTGPVASGALFTVGLVQGDVHAEVRTTPNGNVILTRAAGAYFLKLYDMPSNCTAADNPRTINIVSAAMTQATFNVTCTGGAGD